jgi:hypothetical protein
VSNLRAKKETYNWAMSARVMIHFKKMTQDGTLDLLLRLQVYDILSGKVKGEYVSWRAAKEYVSTKRIADLLFNSDLSPLVMKYYNPEDPYFGLTRKIKSGTMLLIRYRGHLIDTEAITCSVRSFTDYLWRHYIIRPEESFVQDRMMESLELITDLDKHKTECRECGESWGIEDFDDEFGACNWCVLENGMEPKDVRCKKCRFIGLLKYIGPEARALRICDDCWESLEQ